MSHISGHKLPGGFQQLTQILSYSLLREIVVGTSSPSFGSNKKTAFRKGTPPQVMRLPALIRTILAGFHTYGTWWASPFQTREAQPFPAVPCGPCTMGLYGQAFRTQDSKMLRARLFKNCEAVYHKKRTLSKPASCVPIASDPGNRTRYPSKVAPYIKSWYTPCGW